MLGPVLVVLALLGGACSGGDDAADGIEIVATTTIVGDIVRNVVGDNADIEILLPPGADPHDYSASPQQVAALQQADLVVANGLGLEEGLVDVLGAAAADGVEVLELAPAVDPILSEDRMPDPHFWLDPTRTVRAVELLAKTLTEIDASIDWVSAAATYGADITTADAAIETLLATIPPDRRILVTNHDSLAYFADRYGFEVVGTVIPGTTTRAAPNAEDLAALVAIIEARGVSAIFGETTRPSDVAEAVAAEVGRPVAVVELFTGSLGEPGTGADSYIGVIRTNAERIAEALRS